MKKDLPANPKKNLRQIEQALKRNKEKQVTSLNSDAINTARNTKRLRVNVESFQVYILAFLLQHSLILKECSSHYNI